MQSELHSDNDRKLGPLARAISWLVLGYRYGLAWLVPGQCRFAPGCSAYALEALAEHGAWRGGWLALKRIGRCHPWGGHGYDPVPRRREHN